MLATLNADGAKLIGMWTYLTAKEEKKVKDMELEESSQERGLQAEMLALEHGSLHFYPQ